VEGCAAWLARENVAWREAASLDAPAGSPASVRRDVDDPDL